MAAHYPHKLGAVLHRVAKKCPHRHRHASTPHLQLFIASKTKRLGDACIPKFGWIFGKLPKGGRVISNPKNSVTDFWYYKRLFGHEYLQNQWFPEKAQHSFPKKGGGGLSKAVWSFLKVHPNLGTQASLGGAFIKNLNSETALTLIWMPQFLDALASLELVM